ncbi:MAG: glycosyltransferase family 4 protein [Porphyromonadaceae bacterium]|jgi:glycosyltransferase involved in cell wall biosynthesis|nr:glycosyltransferase family 4 protein [Porphyromonadaceae bacterium]
MRIAFCIRPGYDNPLGGDAIQMLKTKEYLEKYFMIKIDIVTRTNEISIEHKIVHVFNFSTYKNSVEFIRKAKSLKIPVVSSSIFWDYTFDSTKKLFFLLSKKPYLEEKEILKYKRIMNYVGLFSPRPLGVSRVFRKKAKWMFENSDIVAPNSEEEGELLLKWINKKKSDKIRVVYNATDIANNLYDLDITENEILAKYNLPQNYILQVGRIEYCKNQLNLVAALMKENKIPIVFVGKIVDDKYFDKLNKLAQKRGNVFFINAVPYSEIRAFYKFAKLHVLLSLRESPGLVSIEALANNCPIVISDKRFLPLNTYFSNQPYVANPLDITEIEKVVLDAYKHGKTSSFDFQQFSWTNVANQTFNIYQELLMHEINQKNE